LSDEIWGSGGRAAAVTAGFQIATSLYTAADVPTGKSLASLGESFGFQYFPTSIPSSPQFRYVHALATPNIWPPELSFEKPTITVSAEAALVFGMLEADLDVRAEKIVYDPQNPFSPQPFSRQKGLSRIAYVLNSSEALRLAGMSDVREAGRKIIADLGVNIVVIKRGPWGAMVFEGTNIAEVPAYQTENVWPIGSGDVFAATFAAYWAAQDHSAVQAAELASRAAATYVDSRVLPISAEFIGQTEFAYSPLRLRDLPLLDNEYHVYLAGPFFNIGQLWLVEEARIALSGMGLRVFSPYHQIGLGSAHVVAPQDIEALNRCRIILALVDGLDPGTLFEVGYARALDKPVVALASSTPDEAMKMISGTKCEIISDFASAMYRASWAAKQ
jgi:nucleoside 2-deoxyribosyltransferase